MQLKNKNILFFVSDFVIIKNYITSKFYINTVRDEINSKILDKVEYLVNAKNIEIPDKLKVLIPADIHLSWKQCN
tara:strand:- start:306 stop:530 length:225 start_codon:yes stop_codon:yes gene_type:complete